MKVLVTGASGFLGGYVVKELADHGQEVFGAVRPSSDLALLNELNVGIRRFDLGDPKGMNQTIQGMDAVVHLAAYYTFTGRKEMYQRYNVNATQDLLDACKAEGVERFLYCSSTEAMGPTQGVADEDSPMRPEYDYGRSKMQAEELVRKADGKGISCTILRPSGVYGPRNVDDVSYWFITSYGRSMATKFVVGSGKNQIQFVHAADVAQGFRLALEKDVAKGRTYIISGERSYSYDEVYSILGEITGIPPPKTHVPALLAKAMIAPIQAFNKIRGKDAFLFRTSTVDSVTEDRSYSIERAKKELGYHSSFALKDGLAETVLWYKEMGLM